MVILFSFQYEKAASELSSHDPPIVLAKYDASDEANRELASQYEIQGFPTIKILRDGGKKVQEYNGPRDAAGIVAYLKKQVGPASPEIKSKENAANLIDEKKIFVVSGDIFGCFPHHYGNLFSACHSVLLSKIYVCYFRLVYFQTPPERNLRTI